MLWSGIIVARVWVLRVSLSSIDHYQMATTAPQQQQQGDNAKPGLRKPVFITVDQLKPGTSGHTLTVKVLESKTVLQKGRSVSQHLRQTRIAECLVGDETGTIVFTARNEQGFIRYHIFRILFPARACFSDTV